MLFVTAIAESPDEIFGLGARLIIRAFFAVPLFGATPYA